MSAPKLTRILNVLADRAAVITVANGYYADLGVTIHREQRLPQEAELPILVIALGERLAENTQNKRVRCSQSVTLTGFRSYDGTDAESIGIEILADIQRAIELEDETLGGLLQGSVYGLAFQSDEIFMPDAGETVVGARVTYAVPHIRQSGDPEIL